MAEPVRNPYIFNFAASVLGGVFFVYGLAKFRSIAVTSKWVHVKRFPRINIGAIRVILTMISVLEVLAGLLLCFFDFQSVTPVVAGALFLAIGAVINKYVFSETGGCPCLGASSTLNGGLSNQVTGFAFTATMAIILASSVSGFGGWLLKVANLSVLLAACILAYRAGNVSWVGAPLSAGMKGKNLFADRVAILFFSLDCEICMRIIRLLDDHPWLLGPPGKTFLLMKGVGNSEEMMFKGAKVLVDDNTVLNNFGVKAKPALILTSAKSFRVFVGQDQIICMLARRAFGAHMGN